MSVVAARPLLEATRHSVDALAEEGRLRSDQAGLLRALLLREFHQGGAAGVCRHCGRGHDAVSAAVQGGAGSSAQLSPAGAGEGVVVGGGWADLPGDVEEGIFGALQENTPPYHDCNGSRVRLVCKEWRRAAARHYTSAHYSVNLAKTAPMLTAELKKRFSALRSLTLDGPDMAMRPPGVGLKHIARAYGAELESLWIKDLDVSPGDLQAVAADAPNINDLRLTCSLGARSEDLGCVLDAICSMTSLTSLDLEHPAGHLKYHRSMRGLRHLTRLEALKCNLNVGSCMEELIPQMTRLRKLHLGASLAPPFLRPITQLQHLWHLTVHAPHDLSLLMDMVAPIQALRKLCLTNPSPMHGQRAYMRPALDELDDDYIALAVAPQVTDLALVSVELARGAMWDVARALRGLVTLELADCVLEAFELQDLEHISGLKQLTVNDEGRSRLDADLCGALALAGLKHFPSMQTLNVTSMSGIEVLLGGDISCLMSATLVELKLAFRGVPSAVSVDALVHAIQSAPNLQKLQLHKVLDLTPYRPEASSEEDDTSSPRDQANADLIRRVHQAAPNLKRLDIDTDSWTWRQS
eukprot:jgi/Tetstr1/466657/TSEL_011145.t1